jgi:hypothetical protein
MRHGEQVSRKPRSNEDHENNQIRSVAKPAPRAAIREKVQRNLRPYTTAEALAALLNLLFHAHSRLSIVTGAAAALKPTAAA